MARVTCMSALKVARKGHDMGTRTTGGPLVIGVSPWPVLRQVL